MSLVMAFTITKSVVIPIEDLNKYKTAGLLDKIRKIVPIPEADTEYLSELLDIVQKLLPDKKLPTIPDITLKRPVSSVQSIKDLWELIRTLFPHLDLPPLPIEEKIKPTIPIGVQAVGAPVMWKKGVTGKGVLIGVIDTGIIKHPDLVDRVTIKRNYTRESFPPSHVHGTHVAGTIAANGKIVGVAKEASLADYRVLNRLGYALDTDIAQAVRDAADDGCKIINMSLGGPQPTNELKAAITYATEKGALIVAAVGNEGDGDDKTDEYAYPALYPEVLGVASVNYDDINKPSPFSNSNDRVDCCSHGEQVLSTGDKNGYVQLTGTSMACPHVAGVAALVYQDRQQKGLPVTPMALKAAVLAYAKDVFLPGKDNSTGYGFITLNQ